MSGGKTPAKAGKKPGNGGNQKKIAAAKQSAQTKGISETKPAKNVCIPCKQREQQIARHEYCEIKSLTLQIEQDKKVKPFTVTSHRRKEPVAPTVMRRYQAPLAYTELVIEALADVEMKVTSYGKGNRTVSRDGDRRGLDMKLTAVASPRHTSFGPPHPKLYVTGINKIAHGQPISDTLFAANRPEGGFSWLSIWPFSAERARMYVVRGIACGIVKKPKALAELGMTLVVMPHEEWLVTIGVPARRRGSSWETGRNYAVRSDELRIRGARVTKRADYYRDGDFEHTTEQTRDHYAEKSTLKTYSGPLKSRFHSIEESDSTKGPRTQAGNWEKGYQAPLVKVSMKSGGVEYELPAGEILQKFLDANRLFDRIVSALTAIKIGWSIKVEKTFLDGEITCGFGYRWPQAYQEENRVYYVERYISLNGSIYLFKAAVEGMAGIEFDPWYSPVGLVAKLYLTLSPSLKGSFNNNFSYTNPAHVRPNRTESELRFDGEIKLEFGAQASGRAFGKSLNAKLALQGSATLSAAGKIGFGTPPSVLAKAEIGDIKVIGEIISSSGSIRKQIDPIIIMNKRTLFDKAKVW